MTEKSLFSFALGLKNAGSLGGTFSFIEPLGTIIDKKWWQKNVVEKKLEAKKIKETSFLKSDPHYPLLKLAKEVEEQYW